MQVDSKEVAPRDEPRGDESRVAGRSLAMRSRGLPDRGHQAAGRNCWMRESMALIEKGLARNASARTPSLA
jgi:hypothetical protein